MISIPTKSAGDFSLPVLGLGTWQMGGRLEVDSSNNDERDVQGIIHAVKQGITHIDTAEKYAAGHTEEIVAQALKQVDREQIFLTSKVGSEKLQYDDLIRSCHESLQRLQTKYLDLFLIHGYSKTGIPLSNSMKAMDFLLENELVKNIGVCNFHIPYLQEAMAATKYKIVNNQIHYSLVARGYEENGTLEFCAKNNILVTAYRPTAKGELAQKGNVLLDELSLKYNKTPVQIAINWVMNKPNVVTIVKTSDLHHLEEDLGALGWRLEKVDEERLDKDFERGETILLPI